MNKEQEWTCDVVTSTVSCLSFRNNIQTTPDGAGKIAGV